MIDTYTVRQWCEGKQWWWRLLLLVWFTYVTVRYWQNPVYTSIISGLNLGIHELGHVVFGRAGEFLGILGGTILQLAAPVFGMYNFWRQEDYFSIALCFGWLGTNFFEIAPYVADARTMYLPLVTPFGGGHAIHDWNYILGELRILRWDNGLALCSKIMGTLSVGVCVVLGGWMVLVMAGKQKA